VAVLGQLTPADAERHGLSASDVVYVAEIDLDALDRVAAGGVRRIEPLPRHPSSSRDISILIDAALPSQTIRATVKEAAPATLTTVREFDRYQGKGIPDGKVSLSLRLVFRSSDRTLTDVEVQSAMDAVIAALKERHEAVQR
jgi:phenylalanyl-tRNA synthetase beta chain